MKTINGAKDLSVEKLTEFAKLCGNNLVDIYINEVHIAKKSFASIADSLYEQDIMQFVIDNAVEIELKTADVCLQFIGQDYNWYNENSRRRNKLKRALSLEDANNNVVKADTSTVVRTEYSIAVADISEQGLSNIETFASKSKVEVIRFMNNAIVRHCTVPSEDSVVVFNLDYNDETKDDILNWFTIKELQEQGKVVLK